jgi:hypothetical protein
LKFLFVEHNFYLGLKIVIIPVLWWVILMLTAKYNKGEDGVQKDNLYTKVALIITPILFLVFLWGLILITTSFSF